VGEVDISLMPIAAWYWRHRYFAPEDSVQAAEDLSCNVFIPWAWGTWIISYEHMLEPPRRLQYAWDQMQPENMELRMFKMGETYSTELSRSVIQIKNAKKRGYIKPDGLQPP
jgi:L-ascorbate metabolism protein UlaG (beta-lactamase superfamily)